MVGIERPDDLVGVEEEVAQARVGGVAVHVVLGVGGPGGIFVVDQKTLPVVGAAHGAPRTFQPALEPIPGL